MYGNSLDIRRWKTLADTIKRVLKTRHKKEKIFIKQEKQLVKISSLKIWVVCWNHRSRRRKTVWEEKCEETTKKSTRDCCTCSSVNNDRRNRWGWINLVDSGAENCTSRAAWLLAAIQLNHKPHESVLKLFVLRPLIRPSIISESGVEKRKAG